MALMAEDALPNIAPMTPESLLQGAMHRGVDADQIEKLIGLYERWQTRRAAEEYARAMLACQKEMPVVVRDKKGQNSKYAPLEAVHATIKATWIKHGFSLSFGEEGAKEGFCRLVCGVRHVGGHTERHSLEGALDTTGPKGEPNKTGIQGKGSTVSYLRRYLTLMIFNVTVQNEDTDGQAGARLVTGDEIRQINELIDECEQLGKPVKVDKFLAWLGVESLEQLTMPGFSKAMWELNRKRRSPKKGETPKA